MLVGSFGSVVFQVSRLQVRTFTSFTRRASANFAEHAVLEDKPILQYTGQALDEISFSITLDSTLGITPAVEIAGLREILSLGHAQPLVIGGYVLGHFALLSIDESWQQVSATGHLIKATVAISLKEFA